MYVQRITHKHTLRLPGTRRRRTTVYLSSDDQPRHKNSELIQSMLFLGSAIVLSIERVQEPLA